MLKPMVIVQKFRDYYYSKVCNHDEVNKYLIVLDSHTHSDAFRVITF